jgi:hypothetical protein
VGVIADVTNMTSEAVFLDPQATSVRGLGWFTGVGSIRVSYYTGCDLSSGDTARGRGLY